MKKYRCKICGYTVEKESLEEDFVCPICGVGKDLFEEVVEDKEAQLEVNELLKKSTLPKRYRCKICGYIYDESTEEVRFQDLSDDWTCPLCGVGKDMFEEIEEEKEEPSKEEIDKRVPIEEDNPGIARIMEKCINCGRCKTICENLVGIKYDYSKTKCAICVNCGQCVLNCPVGALVPKYNYKKVKRYIDDPDKIVVAFTSPAVRVALGEEFGLPSGSFVEGQMIAALRAVGFDYVFDTTFGADLTIMEEASELIKRLQKKEKLPQFTSCCPSWVKYLEIYYPELKDHLSTAKSPISMQGAMIKTYFSKRQGIDPKNVIAVALTPCTAKKAEIRRAELNDSGKYWNDEEIRDTDEVITTSEFAVMLREEGIEFTKLEESKYDDMFDRGSGAGLIFGNSGGVMEAALRTAYHFLTGQNPEGRLLNLTPVRGMEQVKEATVEIANTPLKVAVVYGLPNVVPLLEKLKKNELDYQFIEVMNCPGGCIGGGGQPLVPIGKMDEIRLARMNGIYQKEERDVIRSSYENPDIQKIYEDFLESPLSPLSEELLHTAYEDKSELLKEKDTLLI